MTEMVVMEEPRPITLIDLLRGTTVRRPLRGTRRRVLMDPVAAAAELKRQRKRAYAREWAKRNEERVKAMREADRVKYKARRAEAKRQWRLRNIEHVRAQQAITKRIWNKTAKGQAAKKRYAERHREEINARRREQRARLKEQQCRNT